MLSVLSSRCCHLLVNRQSLAFVRKSCRQVALCTMSMVAVRKSGGGKAPLATLVSHCCAMHHWYAQYTVCLSSVSEVNLLRRRLQDCNLFESLLSSTVHRSAVSVAALVTHFQSYTLFRVDHSFSVCSLSVCCQVTLFTWIEHCAMSHHQFKSL